MSWGYGHLGWRAPWVVLVVIGALLSVGRASYQQPEDDLLTKLIAAHNHERKLAGLAPLRTNAKLSAAARRHAEDLARTARMDHAGSDGSTPSERIRAAGYRFRACGENLAWGQTSVEQVMGFWMNSPIHKANVVGKFTEIGASYQISMNGKCYWCVTFGTR